MKFLIAILISLSLILSSMPARADDDAAKIGIGIIGGMIIGGLIEHDRHHHKHHKRKKYVRYCERVWNEYYDAYRDVWVRVYEDQCWYERVR